MSKAPASVESPVSRLAKAAELWARAHNNTPRVLYHYTTGDGLLGILKGGRLWATNARFMNDPSEIQYAADLVQRVLGEAEKKHKETINALDTGTLIDRLVTYGRDKAWKAPKIDEWAENAIRAFDDQGGAYITCFCRNPDLLSQWRGYGAAGGGYAVGFTTKELRAKSDTVVLRRVIYDPKKQRTTVERWVNAIFALDLEWRSEQKQLLEQAKRGVMKDWQAYLAAFRGKTEAQVQLRESARKGLAVLNEALERFSEFMIEALVCFKNPAYAAEDEWRLIQFGKSRPATLFRVGKGCPLPYVELDLSAADGKLAAKLPISDIGYGPVLESGMVYRSLKTVLQAMGYDHVIPRVRQSRIPYRG